MDKVGADPFNILRVVELRKKILKMIYDLIELTVETPKVLNPQRGAVHSLISNIT